MSGTEPTPIAVLVDGNPAEAVPVVDRGFLYGDALFEVLRTYHGQPAFLRGHLERMSRGGRLLGFREPCPHAAFEADVRALASGAGRDVVLRLYWSRGDGAGIDVDPPTSRRVAMAFELSRPPAEAYDAGVDVVILSGRATVLPGAKVAGYAANVLATRAARAAGAHEALLEDEVGRIEEGATSNVFAVRGGVLVTPPVDRILPGVTRAVILEIAEARGLEVQRTPLSRELLSSADEVFLSSSIRELLPVRSVAGHAVGPPGPVTQRLAAAYRRRLPGASPVV